MKKTKNLLAFLLAFVMLFSLAVVPATAAQFSDVAESYQYYEAIQSLVARGVINGYEDGTFKPEATITRAEFCKMVIYALGLTNLVANAGTDTGFPDVAAEHWAAGTIKLAANMGIVNGYDDGTFKPQENVTYEQAVKMVVCATSDQLAEVANLNGGYPKGYMAVGRSVGLTKNITDGADAAPAMRGTIAKLVHNMINVDLSEMGIDAPSVGVGGGIGSGVGSDGISEVKGQIVSVYGATILEEDDSDVAKEQIRVRFNNGEEEIYSIKDLAVKKNIYEYLGKLVTVYYKEDNVKVQTLTDLTLQRNRNEELTVNTADILPDYSDTSLYYADQNGDEEEVEITDDAIIMFNGRRTESSFEDLVDANINKSGSIRFLSANGNSVYDIVFFTVYDSMFVTNVNSSSRVVSGEGGKSYTIDDEDKNKLVTILKDDKAATFSSIAKGQILSVSQSLDKMVLEVLISTKTAEGVVSNIDDDEVTIGGKTYSYAADVEPADIEAGVNIKMYLDAFNKIVKYEQKASTVSYTYAYLLTFKNGSTSMENKVNMKVIDLNSTTVKDKNAMKVADRLTINGKVYKMPAEYDAALAAIETAAQRYSLADTVYELAEGEVYQPIKYATKDNKVSDILVGKPLAETTDADLKVDASALTTAIKCTTGHTVLGGIYNLTGNTKVLVLPADRSAVGDYVIRTGTNSGFYAGGYYNVLLVDLNKSGTPSLVIAYEDDAAAMAPANEWSSIVPGVVINKKGVENDLNCITVQTGSEKIDYYDETTEFYSLVKKGDIVRVIYETNENQQKMIEEMEIVAEAEEVYAGNEFLKIPSRTGIVKFASSDSGTTRQLREGEDASSNVTPKLSMQIGTAFDNESSLFHALDYADAETEWNKNALANEGKLLNYTATSGAKVVVVEFNSNGTVSNVDTENGSIAELATYVYSTEEEPADKIFVYRSYEQVKLIVVYRAK
ncbi:MAG: S-layer homology domain-containing protein [Ruminococcaceae bacterium]|nr:S-layer homology domain-containing protein [Oscillospiraceae bacterium]